MEYFISYAVTGVRGHPQGRVEFSNIFLKTEKPLREAEIKHTEEQIRSFKGALAVTIINFKKME